MNELQEELKFFIKEIGFYDDWKNFFIGLINIRDRESLYSTESSDSPNCDIEGTLNKLKSLLAQHEPFKTNSEEETESNFTEDVSKSSKEEQEEIGSFYGGCSHCETWEESSSMKIEYAGNLPAIKISRERLCPKHQVDPTNLDDFIIDDNCYDKKCTRETVTGIYALCDIFEIPEENSLPFEEAVTSLRSSLDNLDSYDDIKILKDIMEHIEKIVVLSPFRNNFELKLALKDDILEIGSYIAKMAHEEKAGGILELVLEIDSKLPDLPASAEVEMVQSMIPALTQIRNYIYLVCHSYTCRSYSSIMELLQALETFFKAYCKHQTSINSMTQEEISFEYEKIADSIASLKTINEGMCAKFITVVDY